jgi:hypothetical protein
MSAAEELRRPDQPSPVDDTAIVSGDTLTASERERLANYVIEARHEVFPETLGAPMNRIGESDQQDFYFRGLLDLVCTNASAHGVPAITGSIDDLWRYADEHFEGWTARRKNRFARETVRQVAIHQWPRAFVRDSRAHTFDTRAFDDDTPRASLTVVFTYTPPTEATPFVLAAVVSGFALDSHASVTVSTTTIPPPCWLAAVEDAAVPANSARLAEYGDLLLTTAIRLLPPQAAATARQLRHLREPPSARGKTATRARLDVDAVARLQAAVAGLRSGSASAQTNALRHLDRLLVSEPDLRQGHDLIDSLEDVPPEHRRTILASLALMVQSARPAARTALLIAILFLITYLAPSPLRAALHKTIQRFIDRIVIGETLVDSPVSLDIERDLFVTDDGRASSELETKRASWIKVAPGSVAGGRQFFLSISEPDANEVAQRIKPLTSFNSIGFLGIQYRQPGGKLMPWLVELDLIPRQDQSLASEVVARDAVATIVITPSPGAQRVSSMSVEANGQEHTMFMQQFEFPHHAGTYAITGTVTRRFQPSETYTAQLTFAADGAASMTRPNIAPIEPASKVLTEWIAGCTTIVPTRAELPIVERVTTLLSASAVVGEEQRVTFIVARRGDAFHDVEYVLDFGDGSRAVRRHLSGSNPDNVTHRYREGNRAYTITVYFDSESTVWQLRALYIFADRPVPPALVYPYTAPYGPDSSVSSAIRQESRNRGLSHILYRQRNGRLWPQ